MPQTLPLGTDDDDADTTKRRFKEGAILGVYMQFSIEHWSNTFKRMRIRIRVLPLVSYKLLTVNCSLCAHTYIYTFLYTCICY